MSEIFKQKNKQKIKSIYNFSKKHFFNEVSKQFNKDGEILRILLFITKLSAEIILWTTAFLSRNGEFNKQDKIINGYKVQLIKIYQFSKSIFFHNEMSPQFGDNDSGRFIHITPSGKKVKFEKVTSLYKNLENYKPHHQLLKII